METYSLKTREEIRNALKREFKIEEMKDYASTLCGYFWEKAEAWMTAIRHTHTDKWETEAERKYGMQTGKPRYELETAMDALKTVLCWRDEIDGRMEIVVTEIMANPIEVECDDDDEEWEMHMAWIDEMLSREIGLPSKKSYEDILGVRDVMDLYESTAGIDKFTEEEYHDLFERYGCGCE